MTAIAFRDVSFSQPNGQRLFEGLTFDVDGGEVVALVGPSGAGKSTLLRLINGLAMPTGGAVLVGGRDTRSWDPYALRRSLGYVLQEVGLFPHMTIGDNVGVVPRLEGWLPERTRRRVEELLGLVGLPPHEFAARWPHELSGGQRQRAGVARALAIDPPVLLMDEPFGALDPVTRAQMHREFRRIQDRLRKTVMLVTHDMTEAFALAERIGVLDEGRLLAWDPPSVVARSANPRVRLLLDSVYRFDLPGAETPAER